jgi:hypothetical protein
MPVSPLLSDGPFAGYQPALRWLSACATVQSLLPSFQNTKTDHKCSVFGNILLK